MLGDRISGVAVLGEPENPAEKIDLLTTPGPNGLILKFFMLFLLSYSFELDFSFLVPVLIGGIGFLTGSVRPELAPTLAVSEDPVSI